MKTTVKVVVMLLVTLATSALPFALGNRLQLYPREVKTSVIITERYTQRVIKIWSSVESLAFAQGSDGQVLHPTLRSLWLWCASTQSIYIEIPSSTRASTCTAGSFNIEQRDYRGNS